MSATLQPGMFATHRREGTVGRIVEVRGVSAWRVLANNGPWFRSAAASLRPATRMEIERAGMVVRDES